MKHGALFASALVWAACAAVVEACASTVDTTSLPSQASGATGAASSAGGTGGSGASTASVGGAGGLVEDGGVATDAWPWWDAEAFPGCHAPVPGEYPSTDAGMCPGSCLDCWYNAQCDSSALWCCGGKLQWKDDVPLCLCGETLGCQPPAVCCALEGAIDFQCVPTPDDCRHLF